MRLAAAFGILAVTISPFLAWIVAPVRGGLGAGFGWMAIIVGLMGGVAWYYRSNRLLMLCGTIGLALCSLSILDLTFLNPAFWPLVDENSQYQKIMDFSFKYLPANLGMEPSFEADLLTGTMMDRLGTAAYFMGRGWWICLSASLLVFAASVKLEEYRISRWMAIALLVIFASPGIILFNGFVAQYLQEQGDRGMAAGRHGEALQKYETALRFDRQLARSELIQLRLGEVYYHLAKPTHPNTLFYLGDLHSQQKDFERAIPEYLLAAQEAPAPLKQIIHRRIGRTYVEMGLTQYEKTLIGPATSWWERAMAFDPGQIQAAYFLSVVYFSQDRYEQSISLGRFLLSRSQNGLLNAQILANIGDGYWKLNNFKDARTAYEASMNLDTSQNYRILKSLGGT